MNEPNFNAWSCCQWQRPSACYCPPPTPMRFPVPESQPPCNPLCSCSCCIRPIEPCCEPYNDAPMDCNTIQRLSYTGVKRRCPVQPFQQKHEPNDGACRVDMNTIHRLSYRPNINIPRTKPIIPDSTFRLEGPYCNIPTRKHDYAPKCISNRCQCIPVENCNSFSQMPNYDDTKPTVQTCDCCCPVLPPPSCCVSCPYNRTIDPGERCKLQKILNKIRLRRMS